MGYNTKLATKSVRVAYKGKINNSQSLASPTTPPNKAKRTPKRPIVDSGATDSILRASDLPTSTNVITTERPLTVEMPNSDSISSIGKSAITSAGQTINAHIFNEKDLHLGLIAVADYTSRGLTVSFTDTHHSIAKPDGTIISQTPKEPGKRLWPAAQIDICQDVDDARTPTASASLAIRNESAAEIVLWASATLGNPTPSTLETACRRGYLGNYPNLTSKMIRDNWPNTLATAQGHLQMQRQGVQSTNPKQSKAQAPRDSEHGKGIIRAPRTIETSLFDRNGNVIFADATGRFPLASADGKEYILVMSYKNYIKPIAFANRGADTYVKAFREGIHFFKNLGHDVTSIVMDNETSKPLLRLFQEEKMSHQFVPPGIKRSNKAERAIQTFRNHFLATLGTVHKDFPLNRWDLILQHIETTLNLLHPFQDDIMKSAFEGIFGHKYDFLKHPMGPAGTLVYVFELPSTRDTWATHGEVGFLLGAAMDTYRSYNCLIKSTGNKRTTNTVQFFPEPLHMPGSSKEEQLIKVLIATQKLVIASNVSKAEIKEILNRLDTALTVLKAADASESPKRSADGLSDEEAQELTTATSVALEPIQNPEPITPLTSEEIHPQQQGGLQQRVTRQSVVRQTVGQPKAPTTATPSNVVPNQTPKVTTPRTTGKEGHTHQQRVPRQRVPRQRVAQQRVHSKSVEPIAAVERDNASKIKPQSAQTHLGENNPLQKRRQRKKRTKAFKRRPKESQFRVLLPHERKDKHNAKYIDRIGCKWTDVQTGEKFQITNVVMPNKTKGPGSQTPHFEFIPLPQSGLPTAEYTYEHTRCHEIMDQTGYARWGQNAFSGAIRSTEAYDGQPLNQRADGKKLNLHRELKGPHSRYWKLADREEKIRLLDSGTLKPVKRNIIPRGETITYYNPQCKEKLATVDDEQFVEYRVRGTFGGDRSGYQGATSSQTAEYLTTKVLINATLSDRLHKDPDTKFATADMVDFYLGAMLDQPGYLGMKAATFSQEIIDIYNLREYIDSNGTIYFQVVKCMYGHPASGRLSNKKLVSILKDAGYHEDKFVDCLFKHASRDIIFALVVDDMGIKYSKVEDVEHLVATIAPYWKVKLDYSGSKFLGMDLKWEYERKPKPRVIITSPTVIPKAIARFRDKPSKGRETPTPYTDPVYGTRVQMAPFDDSPLAPKASIQRAQEVNGVLSHYARVVDYSLLEGVTRLAMTQAHPTADTMTRIEHILDYTERYPENGIIFEASDMILTSHADASYQSLPGSRSKLGGAHYFANIDDPPSVNNGLITAQSAVIKVVCSGAAEAEYAALYSVGQTTYFIRLVAEACGYPQTATTIYTDNEVAMGIANRSVKIKRSKSIEKSFHWIRDKVDSGDFIIKWVPSDQNIADYFTKPLPRQRHLQLRPRIIQWPESQMQPDTSGEGVLM